MIYSIVDFIKEILFPKFCLGCKKEGTYLCEDCKATLDILETQYCLCNKNPKRIKGAGKCKKCSSKQLSGLYFALSFKKNFLARKLISRFKKEPYIKELSHPLSSLIIDHLLLSGIKLKKVFKNGVIIPCPQDIKENKRKGFNQAEEIAKSLSKSLKNYSCFVSVLKNCFSSKSQSLKKIKNKKVFLVNDTYNKEELMEKTVKILKKKGIKKVWGISLIREE